MSYLSDLGDGLLSMVSANSGLFIPALIAALAYWWKTKQSIRSDKKLVLYYLLELNFQFSRSTRLVEKVSRSLAENLKARLKLKGFEMPLEEITAGLIEAILPQATTIFEVQNEKLEITAKHYIESVNQLAKSAPLLAYKLNGKELYKRFDGIIKDTMSSGREGLLKDIPEQLALQSSIVTRVFDSSVRFSSDSFSNDIKSDVLRVASSIGPMHYCRCRWLLRGDTADVPEEALDKVMEILEPLIDGLVGDVQKAV